MTKPDFFATFSTRSDRADRAAAVQAFMDAATAAHLTYADLTAESPSEAVNAAYFAAQEAAWPNALHDADLSDAGFIEVFPQ